MTLLELTISVSLMALIAVAILSTMGRATDTAKYTDERNDALDQLRVMVDTISKDLRQGVRVTGPSLSTSSITFDTYVRGAVTNVTWRVTGSGSTQRFERLVGATPAATYVVHLTSPAVFDYAGQTSPASVNRVGLTLRTQLDSRHPPVEVSTEVELRNV